jgi:hypothetical protein
MELRSRAVLRYCIIVLFAFAAQQLFGADRIRGEKMAAPGAFTLLLLQNSCESPIFSLQAPLESSPIPTEGAPNINELEDDYDDCTVSDADQFLESRFPSIPFERPPFLPRTFSIGTQAKVPLFILYRNWKSDLS